MEQNLINFLSIFSCEILVAIVFTGLIYQKANKVSKRLDEIIEKNRLQK